jgi:hypothetical protein
MTVAFRDLALAELCNSRQRVVAHWGEQHGQEIARRLVELHAADLASVGRLPRARVEAGADREMVIRFGSDIEIRCEIVSVGVDGDCFRVTDITVTEGER